MKIMGIRAAKVFAGPGSWAFVAEAEVELADGQTNFVAVQRYDGAEECSVSKDSVYAFMAGDGDPVDLMVDYDPAEYAETFEKLRGILELLG